LKKVFFWIALVIPFIVIIEIFSSILLKSLPTRVRERAYYKTPSDYIASAQKAVSRRPHIRATDSDVQTNGQKATNEKIFHRTLGWHYPPHFTYGDQEGVVYRHGASGERQTCTRFPLDLISSYGDSFTNCAEVQDNETWQTFLASFLKQNVLNYGVNGYGADQALLLFASHKNSLTPIVMLCIYPENINRVVNVYRTFYICDDPLSLTKPRFVLSNGTIRFMENPIRSIEAIEKLSDPSFVAEIGSHDYWYQLGQRLPGLGFPFSYSLFQWRRMLGTSIKASLCRQLRGIVPPTFNQDLYQEPEPLAIMCHIVDRFFSLALERNQYPIVVIIPHTDYVREVLETGASRTDPLLDYMKRRDFFYMDLVRAMVDLTPTMHQLESWYRGHATAEGNSVTAHLIYQLLDQRAANDAQLHQILVSK
jgi:hypothetical protein